MKKLIIPIAVVLVTLFLTSCEKDKASSVDNRPNYAKKSILPYYFGFYGDNTMQKVTPPTGTPDTIPATFNAGDTIKFASRITASDGVTFDNLFIKFIKDTLKVASNGFINYPTANYDCFKFYWGNVVIDQVVPFSKTGALDYSVINLTGGSVLYAQEYIVIYKFVIPNSFKGGIYSLFLSCDSTNDHNTARANWYFYHRFFKVRP